MAIVLLLLVVYPLSAAVLRMFDGAALQQIQNGFGSPVLWRVLANTAVVVGLGAAIALVAGGTLAWIDERTDGHLPGFGRIMALAPLLVPPVAGVMGWAVLLDPNAGVLNNALRSALGGLGIAVDRGPLNIYSGTGLVLTTGLYLVPYVYLIVASALRQLDPALEEASRISQAGAFRTLVKVTLPSIAPAFASAAVLAVISGLGLFSVPFIVGTGARIDVISVYIFRLLEGYPAQTALALVLAGFLFVTVQVLLSAQRLLLKPGRHAAMEGRGYRAARVRLGPLRHVTRFVGLLYLGATALLPVLALLIVSLQPFWSPTIRWATLGFDNYAVALFKSGPTSQALFNSVVLAATTATVEMGVVGLMMLYAHVIDQTQRRLADFVTTVPATIPHTVIGVCFILAFSAGPIYLYGTTFLLLLAYVAMALPFAGRAASSAAGAIGKDLSEASRTFGASQARTFRRILLPLALPGLAAGWAIIFVHTAGEVTASALLASTRNPVVGRVLMDLWNYGSFPQVAALAMIMTVMNGIVVLAILGWSNRALKIAVS